MATCTALWLFWVIYKLHDYVAKQLSSGLVHFHRTAEPVQLMIPLTKVPCSRHRDKSASSLFQPKPPWSPASLFFILTCSHLKTKHLIFTSEVQRWLTEDQEAQTVVQPSHKSGIPNSSTPAFPSSPQHHLPEASDSDINVLSLPYLSITLSDAVHATLTH